MLIRAIVIAVALLSAIACLEEPRSPQSAGQESRQGEDTSMLSKLLDEDYTTIAQQLLRANELLAAQDLGDLDQSLGDLARLQALLDSDALSETDTYDLQCLGIAFGRVLTKNVPGLDWAVVEDELGRDLTIRCEATSLRINALTMISKRVEKGEAVDVRRLYEQTCLRVEELGGTVD